MPDLEMKQGEGEVPVALMQSGQVSLNALCLKNNTENKEMGTQRGF